MAHIYPFKALLPAKGLEIQVSANTHLDSLERQHQIVDENPYTYLNVVKPYLKFHESKDPVKHFPLGKKALEKLIADQAVVKDLNDSFYIYSQVNKNNGREYVGLICTVAVEDYYSGHIKIHENTITEKEDQLILHIETTGVIGEPVLMTHTFHEGVKSHLIDWIAKAQPVIHFEDEYQIIHSIYKIDDQQWIKDVQTIYQSIGDLYIADGHHRSAASAGYFKKQGLNNGRYLCFIVPPESLHIDSFHRAYKSDTVFDSMLLLQALSAEFDVQKVSNGILPSQEKSFGLYMRGQWYAIDYKASVDQLNAVQRLDVSILEEQVFKQILNIKDSKVDARLTFYKGSLGMDDIERIVNAGEQDLVFTVFPCAIEHVFEVADHHMIMPPKSTYIEPKLRTGLTVQSVV